MPLSRACYNHEHLLSVVCNMPAALYWTRCECMKVYVNVLKWWMRFETDAKMRMLKVWKEWFEVNENMKTGW